MNDEALHEKVLNILGRLVVCKTIHNKGDHSWVDGKCTTETLAAKEILHLIAKDRERVEREARLDELSKWRIGLQQRIKRTGGVLKQTLINQENRTADRIAALTNKPKQDKANDA
jgi:hypothetical protein